jgi:AcrR family transcriptional regulator
MASQLFIDRPTDRWTIAAMARPKETSIGSSEEAASAPRWRRRAADRPQEILEAALTVFVTKGFAATKLDDVAAAAGISKGLLYRYFDNKAELFKEVVRQTLVATIRTVGDRARGSDTALAALDMFLDQMITIASDARRSAIPKLVISESGNFPELAMFYLAEVIGPGLQQLSALVRRGVESGELRRVDPELAARSIIAPLLLMVIWRHTFARFVPEPFDPAALVRQHRDILLHGLAAPATSTPGRRKRRSS